MNVEETFENFQKEHTASLVATGLTIAQAIVNLTNAIEKRFPELKKYIFCINCGKLFFDNGIKKCDLCEGDVRIFS